MKMCGAVVCAVAMPILALAQGSVSLTPIGGVAASSPSAPSAASSDVVKVQGRGVGVNKTEALKDAYRDAVERAVGMFVDAEQMVKNDELLKDQVLTQSNAYIEKCEVVNETAGDNGLVTVKILAQVKKGPLVKLISEKMPGVKIAIGDTLQNLHATIVTKELRSADGAALMRNALEGVDPCKQLMKATLAADKPKIVPVKDKADKVRIMYPFQVEIDKGRYFNDFMPKMKQILDQISITPPKKMRIDEFGKLQLAVVGVLKEWREYLTNGPDEGTRYSRNFVYGDRGVFDGLKGYRMAVSGTDIYWKFDESMVDTANYPNVYCKTPETMARGERDIKDGFPVVLVTEIKGPVMKGCLYTVDGVVAKTINEWMDKNTGGLKWDSQGKKGPRYEIAFKDAGDGELASVLWELEGNSGTGYEKMFNCAYVYWNNREKMCWVVSPLLRASAERYVEWVPFDIQKDDLPKIASIDIQLVE